MIFRKRLKLVSFYKLTCLFFKFLERATSNFLFVGSYFKIPPWKQTDKIRWFPPTESRFKDDSQQIRMFWIIEIIILILWSSNFPEILCRSKLPVNINSLTIKFRSKCQMIEIINRFPDRRSIACLICSNFGYCKISLTQHNLLGIFAHENLSHSFNVQIRIQLNQTKLFLSYLFEIHNFVRDMVFFSFRLCSQ